MKEIWANVTSDELPSSVGKYFLSGFPDQALDEIVDKANKNFTKTDIIEKYITNYEWFEEIFFHFFSDKKSVKKDFPNEADTLNMMKKIYF